MKRLYNLILYIFRMRSPFESLDDPRQQGKISSHCIIPCATLCGADDWRRLNSMAINKNMVVLFI